MSNWIGFPLSYVQFEDQKNVTLAGREITRAATQRNFLREIPVVDHGCLRGFPSAEPRLMERPLGRCERI